MAHKALARPGLCPPPTSFQLRAQAAPRPERLPIPGAHSGLEFQLIPQPQSWPSSLPNQPPGRAGMGTLLCVPRAVGDPSGTAIASGMVLEAAGTVPS